MQAGGAWFLKVAGNIRIKSILLTLRVATEHIDQGLQYQVLGSGSGGRFFSRLAKVPFVLSVDEEKEFDLPEDLPIATIDVVAKSLSIYQSRFDSYQVEVGYDDPY